MNLNTVIQDVVTFVEPDTRQAASQIILQANEPDLIVLVDDIQIQQVLVNLIRNALDAMQETPIDQRKVTISTQLNENGQAEVLVRDTGQGIDQDEVELVFNAFFSTKQEGMGMGLAISRSIIEAHEGNFWANSSNGPGATFGFTLPVAMNQNIGT